MPSGSDHHPWHPPMAQEGGHPLKVMVRPVPRCEQLEDQTLSCKQDMGGLFRTAEKRLLPPLAPRHDPHLGP